MNLDDYKLSTPPYMERPEHCKFCGCELRHDDEVNACLDCLEEQRADEERD